MQTLWWVGKVIGASTQDLNQWLSFRTLYQVRHSLCKCMGRSLFFINPHCKHAVKCSRRYSEPVIPIYGYSDSALWQWLCTDMNCRWTFFTWPTYIRFIFIASIYLNCFIASRWPFIICKDNDSLLIIIWINPTNTRDITLSCKCMQSKIHYIDYTVYTTVEIFVIISINKMVYNEACLESGSSYHAWKKEKMDPGNYAFWMKSLQFWEKFII